MTKKYHINSKGVPSLCNAKKGNCPFGGGESHYDSMDAAQEAANKKHEKEFGIVKGANELVKSKQDILKEDTIDKIPEKFGGLKKLLNQENVHVHYSSVDKENNVSSSFMFKNIGYGFNILSTVNEDSDTISFSEAVAWNEESHDSSAYKKLSNSLEDLGFKFINHDIGDDDSSIHEIRIDNSNFNVENLEKAAKVWSKYNRLNTND